MKGGTGGGRARGGAEAGALVHGSLFRQGDLRCSLRIELAWAPECKVTCSMVLCSACGLDTRSTSWFGGGVDAHATQRCYMINISHATGVVEDFYQRMQVSGFECCLSFSCKAGEGGIEAKMADAVQNYLTVPPHVRLGLNVCGSESSMLGTGAHPGAVGAARKTKAEYDMKTIATHFHLPIDTAAKILGIGSTAIKKICRKHGLERWPHRKLKGIDRTISELKSRKASVEVQKKIKLLHEERKELIAFFASEEFQK